MKHFSDHLGLVLLGLLAFSVTTDTAFSTGVRRGGLRRAPRPAARGLTLNINESAGQVNGTRAAERSVSKRPSSRVDKVTGKTLPPCSGKDCVKPASVSDGKVTRGKRKHKGRRSKSKLKINKQKSEDKSKASSLFDRFFSLWGGSSEAGYNGKDQSESVPNEKTKTNGSSESKKQSAKSPAKTSKKSKRIKSGSSTVDPKEDIRQHSGKLGVEKSSQADRSKTNSQKAAPARSRSTSARSRSTSARSRSAPARSRSTSARSRSTSASTSRKRHRTKSDRGKPNKESDKNDRQDKNSDKGDQRAKHGRDKVSKRQKSTGTNSRLKTKNAQGAKSSSRRRQKSSKSNSRPTSSVRPLLENIGKQNDAKTSSLSSASKINENDNVKHGPENSKDSSRSKKGNRKKSRHGSENRSTTEHRAVLPAGGRSRKPRQRSRERKVSNQNRSRGDREGRGQRERNRPYYPEDDRVYGYDYEEGYDYDMMPPRGRGGRRRYPLPPPRHYPRRPDSRGRGRNHTRRVPVYDGYYDGYYAGFYDRYPPRRRLPPRPYGRRRPYPPHHRRRPPTDRGDEDNESGTGNGRKGKKTRHRKDKKRTKPEDDIPEESAIVDLPEETRPSPGEGKHVKATPVVPFAFTTDTKSRTKEVSEKTKDAKKQKRKKGSKKTQRKKDNTSSESISISKTSEKKLPQKVKTTSLRTKIKTVDEKKKTNLESEFRKVHTKDKGVPTGEVNPLVGKRNRKNDRSKSIVSTEKPTVSIGVKNTAKTDFLVLPGAKPPKMISNKGTNTKPTNSRNKSGHSNRKAGKNSGDKKLVREDSRRRWSGGRHEAEERRRQRERDRHTAYQARLLRSKVAQLSDQIMISLEAVLKALRSKVHVAYNRYDGLFNTTRYDIMLGVRSGLHTVVNTNDEVYGIILDMSRLVRHVYKRAHERHLINPATRRRPLEQPVKRKDFRAAARKADQEYNAALYVFNKVKRQKRRCSELKSHKGILKSKMMKLQADYKLRELEYFSNRTIRRVENVIRYNTAQRKMTYLSDTQSRSKTLIMEAKKYNQMAFDHVTDCTLEGWRCTDALRNAKIKFQRAKEYHQQAPSRQAQPTLSPADRSMLRRVIDRANRHAREQDYLRMMIERQVYPLVRQLKAQVEYRKRGGTGGHPSRPGPRDRNMRQLEAYLKEVTQKIDAALEKLRQRVGAGPPTRDCTGDIGSGDGEDGCPDEGEESGSGSLGGFDINGGVFSSGDTTDDSEDDFVFVDSKSTSRGGRKLPSLGGRLKHYTGAARDRSEKLHEEARRMASRVAVMKVSSGRLHAGVSRAGSVFGDAETLLTEWDRDKRRYPEIHRRVLTMVTSVRTFNKSLQSDIEAIDNTVSRVLEKVAGPGGQGAGAFGQVIQSVGKAKTNMKNIEKLTRVAPDPCARTTELRDTIRANLTQLRENIERFKAITSSINLPVSLAGGNFLEVQLKHDIAKSHVSSFEFCVKRASVDGVLAVIPGNNSHSLTIALKEGLVSMTVAAPDGAEIETVTNPADLKTDQWYKVHVNRYGQRYKLSVQSRGSKKVNNSQSAIVLGTESPVQVLPSSLFIGGQPGKKQGKNSFSGCVSDVRFGGREVNIYKPDITGLYPPICSSGCFTQSTMVFDGSGFLSFPATIYPRRGITSINVFFRTLQRNTLLFLLGYLQKDVFLIASIEKGIVVVSMTTTGRTTSQRTVETSYSDGKFHNLMISLAGNRLTAAIDGKPETFTPENSAEFLKKYQLNSFMVGGISPEASTYLKRNMSPFSGCMMRLEINQRELFLSDSGAGQGVHTGSCSQSIVSNCVRFTTKSQAIVLPEFKEGRSLSFMFKADKVKGYLFNYKRGQMLDLYGRLVREGLELTENVEDGEELIPAEIADGWHHITLRTDEGKEKVYVRVDDGEETEFSFSGGFWGQKKTDGPVTISIQTRPEDNAGDAYIYEGSVAHLLVDNSPVDMGEYAVPNTLEGCRLRPSSAQSLLTKGSLGKVC